MNKPLLECAMAPATLNEAWRSLRKEHTPWSVGVNRDMLERDLFTHLLELREQVLDAGYRPEPLRLFNIPKPNGKKRRITAHYLKDKLLQRALLIVLNPRAEARFHNDSYGYRKNRGVDGAMAKVTERVRAGLDWLVDADIETFFDSIPHRRLHKTLKHFVRDRRTERLMHTWLEQGAHSNSILRGSQGIAQGSILSPLYCNLYLHDLDVAMAKRHIPFVRYADDFILQVETRGAAEAALQHTVEQLKLLGLRLNEKKTRIVRSSPEVVFLGKPLPRVCR